MRRIKQEPGKKREREKQYSDKSLYEELLEMVRDQCQ